MSETAALWLRQSGGRLLLSVKAVPGAARSACGGLRDGALLLRLAAPPEKGKANEEARRLLAELLGLPKSEIELVSGASGRRKSFSLPLGAEEGLRSLAAD